jgi:hypothetical protein
VKIFYKAESELMVCPRMERCKGNINGGYHCHIHERKISCEMINPRCPACEIFLGVVVENERRIDGMSESRELSESKATNA